MCTGVAGGLVTVLRASGSLAIWDREYTYWSAAQLELEAEAVDQRVAGLADTTVVLRRTGLRVARVPSG